MLTLTGSDLRFGDIQRVIDDPKIQVKISDDAKERVRISRQVIEKAIERDETIYGVNTGFGKLSRVRIPIDKLIELQRNLILSHATAIGEPLDPIVAKIVLLLRINALAKGYSGVRLKLLDTMMALFNKNVIPRIPRQGSVGASGDLAPLAHLTLVLMGLGEAFYDGHMMSGKTALKKAGIAPITLQPKEGLALINGTQIMTAVGAYVLLGAENLARHADISAAMSVEALKGTNTAFDPRIQEVRPFKHQAISARNLRKLLSNSWILASHVDCGKVQDPYCLRCVPQVHGASRAAFAHVKDALRIEFNSANDNPLIFSEEGDILSGGNFHGQPIALAADYLGIAIAELANIAE
ncbi:MAG: aromatic amino acid lyase, partial [Planctomycetes bacterium]|nr:aromatic amino acid lyase [Planctomycetota bacterium]